MGRSCGPLRGWLGAAWRLTSGQSLPVAALAQALLFLPCRMPSPLIVALTGREGVGHTADQTRETTLLGQEWEGAITHTRFCGGGNELHSARGSGGRVPRGESAAWQCPGSA
jgi:hypothetical protein